MSKDKPVFLLHIQMRRGSADLIEVNIRESGEPESTARVNVITVNAFRSIFLNYFKTEPENLDADIEKLRQGHSNTIYLSVPEDAIDKSGLLT